MQKLRVAAAILMVALGITYTGCKKDDEVKQADALMMNLGNPYADGCGWVIRINQVDFKPEKINDQFLQDSLPVRIKYKVMPESYQCGIAANVGFNYIRILSIRKR